MAPAKPKGQGAFEKQIASLESEFNRIVALRTTPAATRTVREKRLRELKEKARIES